MLYHSLLLILSVFLSTRASPSRYHVGVDCGTSGIRICVINTNNAVMHSDSIAWNTLDSSITGALLPHEKWIHVLSKLLVAIPSNYRENLMSICVSGTSSSCLVYDKSNDVVTRGVRMYDYSINTGADNNGPAIMNKLKVKCPSDSVVLAPTSTLAKLLDWNRSKRLLPNEVLLHQADYIGYMLSRNKTFTSDWHNALKLGFDVQQLKYPTWLLDLLGDEGVAPDALPNVVEPGTFISKLSNDAITTYGLNKDCALVGGTTDSIAAFLASNVNQVGQGVSSLGSTLAIKMLSSKYVSDPSLGIYSHRLGNQWLVGGASNVGCAILRQESFSEKELIELSAGIDPLTDSPLEYYPLLKIGERFPVNDPKKEPLLEPKPFLPNSNQVDRRKYLHGILQSIARIEKQGYDALTRLGASPVTEVYSSGGGSKNEMWTRMRQRILGVPTKVSTNVEAAYGSALLAKKYL